ncbi:MAG: PIN domain-containing protein [Nanoarchaeota archaeon]
MDYVTDTHGLIWYLTEDKRLGKNAFLVFSKADKGDAIVIVPTIVLAEIIYICERKRKDLEIKSIVDKIKNSTNYLPYSLNMDIIDKVITLKEISDMHDRIIIAISLISGATLISKDEEIIKSKIVRTIW